MMYEQALRIRPDIIWWTNTKEVSDVLNIPHSKLVGLVGTIWNHGSLDEFCTKDQLLPNGKWMDYYYMTSKGFILLISHTNTLDKTSIMQMIMSHLEAILSQNISISDVFSGLKRYRVDTRGNDGYVYILRTSKGTKIGMSKNVESRIKALRASIPETINNVESFKVKNCRHVEYKLHRLFYDKRIKGEWFNLNDRDIIKSRNLINDYQIR